MLPEPASATLDHIGRLAAKQITLRNAQIDAEDAFLAAVARLGLSEDALLDVYERFRAVALPGFTLRWEAAFGSTPNGLIARGAQRRLNQPNGPGGLTWVGTMPMTGTTPAPLPGVCVVYVLFDADLTPCYVGSTSSFRSRLRRHRKDGKAFQTWTAFPCEDREAAYVLEDRLLREYKPYLNVKAGR